MRLEISEGVRAEVFNSIFNMNTAKRPFIAAKVGIVVFVLPNVRAKGATTAGHRALAGENVPRTTGRRAVACRWRST
jgi:hypothetical protein